MKATGSFWERLQARDGHPLREGRGATADETRRALAGVRRMTDSAGRQDARRALRPTRTADEGRGDPGD